MDPDGEAASPRIAVVTGQSHLTSLVQPACRIESKRMRRYCNALSQNLANSGMQHSKSPVRNFEVSGLVDGCAADRNPVRLQLQQHLGRNGWWSQQREA